MSASRKTVRQALAAVLTNEVDAAQVVYAYQPGDFGGQSPAVCVGSAGSERPRMTLRGARATFYLDLDIFVLTAEAASSTYTQADSENALDDVEQQIAAVVASFQETGSWNTLDYAGRSQTDFVIVDGREYKRERIPLQCGVFS